MLMRLLLLKFRMDIKASQNEKYLFVIQIASGKLRTEEISIWLDQHTFNLD